MRQKGEVLALTGRNGMGKTFTVRTICRMMASQGDLRFYGNNLLSLLSYKATRLGIGLVPEGRRCFRDLMMAENLLVAARPGVWDRARVAELFPRLEERAVTGAGGRSRGAAGAERDGLGGTMADLTPDIPERFVGGKPREASRNGAVRKSHSVPRAAASCQAT